MLIKKRNKRGLSSLETRFIDFSKNSPEFFNVSFMPEQFTSGKNVFKFRPNTRHLDTKKKINIEVLDVNGNPIYHDVLPYKESDGSLVVTVYIYEETPAGDCTITFIGTAIRDEGLRIIPSSEVTENNFKYQHKIYVDPEKKNDSEIIFIQPPSISIKEKQFSVVEEKFLTGSNKIFSYSATGSYYLIDDTPVFNARVTSFSKPLVDGILKFPTLGSDYQPIANFTPVSFSYETTIVDVISPFEMELEDKLRIYGNPDKVQTVTSVRTQPYEVTFSYTPSRRLITQNIKSYAQIDISGLQPDSGEVNRIKVFAKSTFKPKSEYELLYDFEVISNNILVDTGSKLIEYPIGIFNANEPYYYAMPSGSFYNFSGLDYWGVSKLTSTGPTGSILSDSIYLFDGLEIIPDTPMSESSELLLVQTASVQIPFYTDTDYRLKFDYILYDRNADSRGPGITAYISGSSFVNTNSIGKLIGSIPTSSKDETISFNYEIKIPIDLDGNGILKFVLRPGCKISNIRIIEDLDKGFSPERTRLYVPLSIDHRNEYLDFKLQFFNYSLREANTSVKKRDVFFGGGNKYIYGDDNLITGSTYLSPYTASQIHLYANFQSGSSGTTSGSAVQSYGYGGTQNAITNPTTSSNYGFGLTYGDPYNTGNYSRATVQMINECGSIFDFRSTPPAFNLKLIGSNSEMLLGCSGSAGGDAGGDPGGGSGCDCDFVTCGQSYIKWNGCKIIISGAVDATGAPIGSGGTGGTPGPPGANGTSGTSGTSGTNGTSGTSGTNGTSGTTGAAGSSGTSGTSGTTGTNGTSGTSGTNGTSGTSGTNGTSGSSGNSGSSGTSGTNGTSGSSGTSGTNGTSGSSGNSGSSGTSGVNGTSGTSGTSGTNGPSGTSGTSGTSGINGTSGTSGTSFTCSDLLACCDTIKAIMFSDCGTVGKNESLGLAVPYAGSNPTGSAEYTGSTYFNTTSNELFTYNGSIWVKSAGSSGTSGTSGINGTSGTSGINGTSGTGFNTINNAGSGRLIVSDGTTNAATASTDLTFTSNRFQVTGSLLISGSSATGLFVNGLTTTSDNLNRLTYVPASGRIFYEVNKYKVSFGDGSNSSYSITHSLNSADIQVNIRDNSSGQIYYPSISAGSPPQYTATVADANTVTIAFTSPPSVNQYTIVVSK